MMVTSRGDLRRVVVIEKGRPRQDLSTQLHAVARAEAEAKRALIHDQVDHCAGDALNRDLAEIKSRTKLL